MDHRRHKTAADGIIGTLPFIYSLVSRTYTVSMFGRPNENQPHKVVGIANLIFIYFLQLFIFMVAGPIQMETLKSL